MPCSVSIFMVGLGGSEDTGWLWRLGCCFIKTAMAPTRNGLAGNRRLAVRILTAQRSLGVKRQNPRAQRLKGFYAQSYFGSAKR